MTHAIPSDHKWPGGSGQGPDADEPLDPVEGADQGFPQSEAEEFRQGFTNDRSTVGQGVSDSEGSVDIPSGEATVVPPAAGDEQVIGYDDLEPDYLSGAGENSARAPSTVQSSMAGSLEALAAGVKAKTTAGQAPFEEGISPLAGLLARVRKSIAESEQLKVDRKVLDAGGLTKAQREALRAKILRMEADVEWTSKSCLAVMEVQHCSCCDSRVTRLYGIFARQERKLSHKDKLEGKAPAERLVRWCPEALDEVSMGPLFKLPREHTHRFKDVAACATCIVDGRAGFNHVVEIDWEKVQ